MKRGWAIRGGSKSRASLCTGQAVIEESLVCSTSSTVKTMYTIFCIYSKIINHIYLRRTSCKKADIFHKWRGGGQTKASEAEELIKEVHFPKLKESCAVLTCTCFLGTWIG